MRYRLRMHELIPREMSQYRIADGRVHFIAPKLFEVSLCIKGAKKDEGWFFDDVEFLFHVSGDITGMQGQSYNSLESSALYSFAPRFSKTSYRYAQEAYNG